MQTAPTITATTELAAVQQEASRITSSEIDAAHAAQSERDCARSTVVDLREELAVQTASTATATTALADAQQEAARAISWANEDAEGHRAAQLERDGAFSTVADLREEMTVHTASTTTVTTALAAAQEEAARATSWANEAAAGRRAAERERDCIVATTINLQEALAVQAAPTATTELAAVQQEASRTTSSEMPHMPHRASAIVHLLPLSICGKNWCCRPPPRRPPLPLWQTISKRLPAPSRARTKPQRGTVQHSSSAMVNFPPLSICGKK